MKSEFRITAHNNSKKKVMPMKCPYCGEEMEQGQITTNAVFHFTMRHPANIIFEPDINPTDRKLSSPLSRWEGWYCKSCQNIVGIFQVSRRKTHPSDSRK